MLTLVKGKCLDVSHINPQKQRIIIYFCWFEYCQQVVGKIPFESPSPRALLALISSGPVYPSDIDTSTEVQATLDLILKDEDTRPTIEQIRTLPWYMYLLNAAPSVT